MQKKYLVWFFSAVISIVIASEVKGEEAKYIGLNKCKMCHMKEYKAWQETKHAKAFESLTKADDKTVTEVATKLAVTVKGKADTIPECIICHTTGYKSAGGYPEAGDNLKNITCEVCHGAGSIHFTAKKEDKKKTMSTKPDENVCKTCHTEKTSPNFKFEEYVKKGVHQVK